MKKYEDKFVGVITKIGGWDKSAAIAERSVAQLKRYAKGDDAPLSVMKSLTSAAGVSLDWLIFDTEKPFIFNDKGNTEGVISLPVMNISASAGGGAAVMQEEAVGFVGFDAAYLRSMHLTPADLFTLPTTGESMEPTVKAGEFLLCSRSENHVKPGDGIYVVRLEGDVLVKRLQRLPGEKLLISSDNTAYKPYEIKLNDGIDFAILGKVVFVHGLRRV